MADEDICSTCRQTRRWHEENKPHHAFQEEGQGGSSALNEKKKPIPVSKGLPADNILRLVLIERGLIGMDDVAMMEERVRHAAESGEPLIVEHGAARFGTANTNGGSRADLQPGDGESP